MRPRLTLAEYQEPITYRAASETLGVEPQALRQQLDIWAENTYKRLRVQPLVRGAETFRFINVAGVFRLHGVDVEVAPKFLADQVNWQQDLYAMLVLRRPNDLQITSAVGASSTATTLSDLLAVSLIAALAPALQRGPIRQYREREVQEWDLVGDYDPLDLYMPEPDGLNQRLVELSQDNYYNRATRQALFALGEQVSSFSTREKVLTLAAQLGEQSLGGFRHWSRLPIHYRTYQSVLALVDVVNRGAGITPAGGELLSIGFVLDMIREWQLFVDWLIRRSLSLLARRGNYGWQVQYQPMFWFASDRAVHPDNVLVVNGKVTAIMDAKYKDPAGGTSSSDLYETDSFLHATKSDKTLLLYHDAEP